MERIVRGEPEVPAALEQRGGCNAAGTRRSSIRGRELDVHDGRSAVAAFDDPERALLDHREGSVLALTGGI